LFSEARNTIFRIVSIHNVSLYTFRIQT